MILVGPIRDRPIGKRRTTLLGRLTRWHQPHLVMPLAYVRLLLDRGDAEAIDSLAWSYTATRQHRRAIPLLVVLGQHEKSSKAAPKHPGQDLAIACHHWMAGDRARGVELMHGLVDGVARGKIAYGDMAGAVSQGLLLYYMGVRSDRPDMVLAARTYLEGRVKREAAQLFPGPVARRYLGQLSFEDVLEAATGERDLGAATEVARGHLRKRRELVVALFHDGVLALSEGNADEFMLRARQCVALQNPIIEDEWYLARHELDVAARFRK